MNWKAIWAAGFVAAAFAAPPAMAQLSESVAAIVNDKVISTYDVRQRANLLLISAGVQPTPELQQRARAQALRDLVDEELQIQEATGDPYHIEVAEADIDRRLESIARSNNVSTEEFTAQLAQSGVGVSTLRHQLRADIVWQRLMGGLYGTRVRVSELEIRETQARIAADATQPRFLISEIFLPAENEQEFTEMSNGGMQLLEQMQRGVPFPSIARQFSAAPSAAAGGDVGWMASSEVQPELLVVLNRLQPGQVSTPIRTPTGVYIIALRERQESVPEGATQRVSLRQISAPAARRTQLERVQRRVSGCGGLDASVGAVEGGEVVDLGETAESDLSEGIRTRITGIEAGTASPVVVEGDRATSVVVCSRQTGGGGVPSSEEISNRLYDQEMAMLSERYLRNLRREATIITR
ncbi:MAG: peptidylprolyl isomerase [Terricaulis sp.]